MAKKGYDLNWLILGTGNQIKTSDNINFNRETEPLCKLETANDEARKWRLRVEELEQRLKTDAPSITDVMESKPMDR